MASTKLALSRVKPTGQGRPQAGQRASRQWLSQSDEAAFARISQATSGLLFGLLLHALRDTNAAEEVLSDVYSDIKWAAFRYQDRNTRPLIWMITLAHWRVFEHRKRGRPGNRFAVAIGSRGRGPQAGAASDLSRSSHERLVTALLASLSPTQLDMIEMAYFSHMAPVEIALRLGQRVETVRLGLQDGMSKFCRLFKDDLAVPLNQVLPQDWHRH